MNPEQAILNHRKQIAEIDQQLARLCLERIKLAEQVYDFKKSQQCPAVDLVQEAKVLGLYQQALQSQTTPERIQTFVQSLIRLSKVYPMPRS